MLIFGCLNVLLTNNLQIKAPEEVESEMEQKGLNSTLINHVRYQNAQMDQAHLKISRLKMWFEIMHSEKRQKGGQRPMTQIVVLSFSPSCLQSGNVAVGLISCG